MALIMQILINVPNSDRKIFIEGNDNEGILKTAQKHNSFSPYLQKLVIDLCETGNEVIVNAGANLGLVCIPLSFFCKTIIAFEPVPDTYSYLIKNLNINQISNITPYNSALSDKTGTLSIEQYGWDKSDYDIGHSVVIDKLYCGDKQYVPESSNTTIITVPSVAIDSLELNQIDILLLDTEGYEPYVINGAVNTIKRHKPKIIIEHEIGHIKCRNMTSQSIISDIQKLGYDIVNIVIKKNDDFNQYELLPVEMDNDFLTIFNKVQCVDLLFQ